jgi:hypothetical protein
MHARRGLAGCAIAAPAIAALAAAVPLALGATPDLSGYWQVIDAPATLRTTTGALPPLLPEARERYGANQRARAAGDLSFDTTVRCLPPGLPRVMLQAQPFEVIQRDTYLYMLFNYQHLDREIIFRPEHAPLLLGRRFLGDSIAHWDGDTLVVDTTGLKTGTVLDDAGLPHSKDLHLIERYRLAKDGRELLDTIRIDDPKTFAAPWDTILRFRRLRAAQFNEDVCVDRRPDWLKDLQKAEP